MYLLAKLKPFEQKEHFSLKEQNVLGGIWPMSVEPVLKWGWNSGPPGWKVSTNPLNHQSYTMYLTMWQPGLSKRHLCLTERETACPSGMTDDCPVRLVASSSSFDSFYDQYYRSVYNCQSNQFSLIIVFIIGQLEP